MKREPGRGETKKQEHGRQPTASSTSKFKAATAATADQLRMAEMMDGTSGAKANSKDIPSMVNKVMDVTGKTEDQATTALHDCGYDEEKAIHSLLEGDGGDDEWTSVKTKQKKQAFGIAAGSLSATGSANSFGRPAERGVNSRGKPGRSTFGEPSQFGMPSPSATQRDDRPGFRANGRFNRGGAVRGGSGGRGVRPFAPGGRGTVKRDDESKPDGFHSGEKSGGAWGMGSPAGSGAAQPGPKVSKFEDESDGWSTAANATPSKSELQTSGWGEAGATTTATTTGGWGAVNGKPGSKWIDEITEPSSTKPWPLAETKEQTGAWPSPAADATPKTSNEGATWPKSAPSARSDIESWRAGVEDHRPVTSACPDDEPWRAGSDAVRSEEWTSASAIPNTSVDQAPDPVADPAALVGELDGVSPPTSASPAVADAVYPADATVLELPISEKLACHISFPLNEPEVIKTAMYVRRPSIPSVGVVMPPMRHVIKDVGRIQFGCFSASTAATNVQDDRSELAPASPINTTAPVSSMDAMSLQSSSLAQGTLPADDSTIGMHPTPLAPLSHIRPPPGHAPIAAADPQQLVAEGRPVDSQPAVGANALLSLSDDLLPSSSAAIPIPGSGNRSSQQSTPVGSVGTGTPSFIERPSAIGSAPGADAGLSHQSPLIGGTPPLTSLHGGPSTALPGHGSPQVGGEAHRSPGLAGHGASPSQGSPFHSASPPAPIALPPSQQQSHLPEQKAANSSHPQVASAAAPAAQGQQQQQQQQQQQTDEQHRQQAQQASQPSASHHQHHHTSHGQSHQHHHAQSSTNQSSSGTAGGGGGAAAAAAAAGTTGAAAHHGPAGAPPGMGNLPAMRMGMGKSAVHPGMMMGHGGHGFVPNYMGMPMVPGYTGDFDAAAQRNLAMSGVRDSGANFQGTGDSKYGHEGSSSSSSILGTPGVNYLTQPQPQQILGYYPSMYMPMVPFPATMYGGFPHVQKGAPFGPGGASFIPPPGPGFPAGYEDVDYKNQSFQTSTQGTNKGSNTSTSYSTPSGGSHGNSYNKSHFDKQSYHGSSAGLFPVPGTNPSTHSQAASMAAFQHLSGSQHGMMPTLPTGNLPAQAALHNQYHMMEAGAAAAAVSGQTQSGGRAGMASAGQLQSGNQSGPKHHSSSGSGTGGGNLMKGQHNSFSHANWP